MQPKCETNHVIKIFCVFLFFVSLLILSTSMCHNAIKCSIILTVDYGLSCRYCHCCCYFKIRLWNYLTESKCTQCKPTSFNWNNWIIGAMPQHTLFLMRIENVSWEDVVHTSFFSRNLCCCCFFFLDFKSNILTEANCELVRANQKKKTFRWISIGVLHPCKEGKPFSTKFRKIKKKRITITTIKLSITFHFALS